MVYFLTIIVSKFKLNYLFNMQNSYLKVVKKVPLYFPPEWVYFQRPVGPREVEDMREGNIVVLF